MGYSVSNPRSSLLAVRCESVLVSVSRRRVNIYANVLVLVFFVQRVEKDWWGDIRTLLVFHKI